MTAEEYVDFDVETYSFLPAINSDMVDWRISLVKACVIEYLRKECGDLNEVTMMTKIIIIIIIIMMMMMMMMMMPIVKTFKLLKLAQVKHQQCLTG